MLVIRKVEIWNSVRYYSECYIDMWKKPTTCHPIDCCTPESKINTEYRIVALVIRREVIAFGN